MKKRHIKKKLDNFQGTMRSMKTLLTNLQTTINNQNNRRIQRTGTLHTKITTTIFEIRTTLGRIREIFNKVTINKIIE